MGSDFWDFDIFDLGISWGLVAEQLSWSILKKMLWAQGARVRDDVVVKRLEEKLKGRSTEEIRACPFLSFAKTYIDTAALMRKWEGNGKNTCKFPNDTPSQTGLTNDGKDQPHPPSRKEPRDTTAG